MDSLPQGEIVMSVDGGQKEVMELLLSQESTDCHTLTVNLEQDPIGENAFDTGDTIADLADSIDDDTDQSLHIGDPEDVIEPNHLDVHSHILKEEPIETDEHHVGTTSESLNLHSSLSGSGEPVLQITADGQVIFSSSHASNATTSTLQTITLADGTTAYLQQSCKEAGSFQTVELEDGTTALVSAGSVQMPQKQVDTTIVSAKFLEGQTVQLEDGTTAFIQAAAPKSTDHLQAVQLEDGTTAYLTQNFIAESELKTSSLLPHVSHGSEATQSVQNLLGEAGISVHLDKPVLLGTSPTRPPSERALALGEKAYKCLYEGCGRLYTTQHHLKIHERSHTGDRPFKCGIDNCTRAFATSYGLKSHIRVHTGEKPYKCPMDECQKAFKTSGDLQKHVRTHTGEKPFKCPFEGCDRAFTTSNIRKVHIRTHTGERPYACTYHDCGKAFASATNYKNHIRIHSGEKPYVCTVEGCGKRFTEYSSLYKHHVVHTHSKPYVCPHCGKTYRQTSTLAMHKRTAHGDSSEDVDIVLTPGVESQIDSSKGFSFNKVAEDEDGDLVINTAVESNSSQFTLVTSQSSATDGSSTSTSIEQTAQEALQAIQNQPGLALTELTGQQIFVVTDPSQLEMIQQLTQQANLVFQAEAENTITTITPEDEGS